MDVVHKRIGHPSELDTPHQLDNVDTIMCYVLIIY